MSTTNDTGETMNGAELLDEVRAVIARYVVLPSEAAGVAVVLWIAATHAVSAWNCAPRLVIRAPEKRCGKSRLLDMADGLSHRPLMTTNASPSAVYRSIGLTPSDPPTLLIDEADTIFGPKAGDNEDLRGLLNAGHQRGRPTLRYDAGSRSVEQIETFAMAALAGIGMMPDTIEDRAAVIRMRRRAAGETVYPYRVRRDGPVLAELRDRLHEWVTAHLDDLTNAAPAMPLEDRAADTWEPLIALADLAGGDWPRRARNAALTLIAELQDSTEASQSIRLLIDCRTAFGAARALPSTVIVQRLRHDEESPWAEVPAPGGLTVRRLAALLREYDITPKNHRWEDGTQSKGYARDDFADTWARYCPTEAETTTEGEPVPNRPNRPIPGHAGDGSLPRDGSNRPDNPSVPALTWEGTVGTDGTDHPHLSAQATCIGCRQPLSNHSHATCESA
ncbi:uncharacterized protein DUF3631 [Kribbella voronezhensis]|uniref:Uncharacterized protein DUF3631 n=1 Tax=Kribbella voronezhensis TaxID=2512212 RepID=A0A4R7TDL7_9ACTN|nr:DUF3631 domain-containing protein [Kribbella voronezhensis]TDU89447.1 uncharacterized protein DUF3631 [Kribbella voronezhensis]